MFCLTELSQDVIKQCTMNIVPVCPHMVRHNRSKRTDAGVRFIAQPMQGLMVLWCLRAPTWNGCVKPAGHTTCDSDDEARSLLFNLSASLCTPAAQLLMGLSPSTLLVFITPQSCVTGSQIQSHVRASPVCWAPSAGTSMKQ